MKIKRFLQIFMAVTLCCVATACDNNDKEEPEAPAVVNNKLNYALAQYVVELPQDIVDLWDVEVRYTDADGNTSVEKMYSLNTCTISVDWDTESTPLSAIPQKVTMSVVGKPKATPVTLDPEKLYKIGKKYKMTVNMKYNNGKTDSDFTSSGSELSAKGDKLSEAVTKEREILPAISLNIPHEYIKK